MNGGSGGCHDRRCQRCQLPGRLCIILGVHLAYQDHADRRILPNDLPADESAMCKTNISPSQHPVYGVSSKEKSWTFWLMEFMPVLFEPQGNAEMVAIAKNVTAQSGLDWIVFRIPHPE